MPKPLLAICAGVCLVLLLLLGWFQWRETDRQRQAAVDAEAAARAALEAAGSTNVALASEDEALRARVGELEKAATAAVEAVKAKDSVEKEMRSALNSKEVTITELQGRLTVNILDRVLFDSGRAQLRPEGQAILLKVAKVLSGAAARRVEVIGHTDNIPIRTRTVDGFTDNWTLSQGRALAAARFLIDQGGLAPNRLSAAGCSEYRPIADNATPEGRARNRRIEVVVLPEGWLKENGPASTGGPSGAAPAAGQAGAAAQPPGAGQP